MYITIVRLYCAGASRLAFCCTAAGYAYLSG